MIVDAVDRVDDAAFVDGAHELLHGLVSEGAALGWLEPPSRGDVDALLRRVADAARRGDAALVAAHAEGRLLGLGYWLRYERPTLRPHADLEKVAVRADRQGAGIGTAIVTRLIDAATAAGIEVLTLDVRGDNETALRLYRRLGFVEYGRLRSFVAVGEQRYDRVLYALRLRHV